MKKIIFNHYSLPSRDTIFTLFIILFLLSACTKQEGPKQVSGVRTEAIKVDASCDSIQDTAYLARLASYKEVVDREMNVRVGYVPDTFWVGAPECPLLNWLTDALWEAAKQVYPGQVDGAFVNMGSVRGEWLPGDLTFGQIYTIMPFVAFGLTKVFGLDPYLAVGIILCYNSKVITTYSPPLCGGRRSYDRLNCV